MPAATSSGTSGPSGPGGGSGVGSSSVNRVPSASPAPAREKTWRRGPRWPPGCAHRQPLSRVASSRATHSPMTECGSVGRKVASWWQVTSPPMRGCLKMCIDWRSSGCSGPRAATVGEDVGRGRSGRRCRPGRAWAWPILLMARSMGTQLAVGVEGLLLEEAAHRRPRRQEPLVGGAGLLVGGEHRHGVVGRLGHDLGGPSHQLRDRRRARRRRGPRCSRRRAKRRGRRR